MLYNATNMTSVRRGLLTETTMKVMKAARHL
jgi:hypothetical protein